MRAFALFTIVLLACSMAFANKELVISAPQKLATDVVVAVPQVKVVKNGKTLELEANVNINGKPALLPAKKTVIYTLSNGTKLQMRADLMSDFTRFLIAKGHTILFGETPFTPTAGEASADLIATTFFNQALKAKPAAIDEGVYFQHLVGAIVFLQQSVKQDVVIAKVGTLLMDYTPDAKLGANKLTFSVSDKGIDVYQDHFGKKVAPGKGAKKVEESYRLISTYNSNFRDMKAQIKITKLN